MSASNLSKSFDKNGVPHDTRSGMRFPKDTAFRIEDYTPPAKNEMPDKVDDQIEDRAMGLDRFWGWDWYHPQQQMYAREHLRKMLGFNTVIVATVHYSDGPKDLYLHKNGSWEEVGL